MTSNRLDIATGIVLRKLRQDSRLTLKQAAAISGLSFNYISQIELGGKHPSATTLTGLAETYHVGVSELYRLIADQLDKQHD